MSETGAPSGATFAWARRAEIGEAAAARRTLYASLVTAGASLKVPPGVATGPRYLLMSYGLFALLPVLVLNGALALIQFVSTHAARDPFSFGPARGVFDFNDINPYTVVVGGLFQLAVAVPHVWLFSWCLYFGMKMAAGGAEPDKARVRATGWCVGATVYAFWMLLIGGLLFVDVLWTTFLPFDWSPGRSGALEDVLNVAIWAFPVAVVLLGTRAGTGRPWPQVATASVVGGFAAFLAMLPISMLLVSLALMVMRLT